MGKIKFGTGLIIILALTLLVSACDQVQPPQKVALKGTSTKTPFQIKATFTSTSEPPPTFTPSQTPTDTPTPTNTEEITETPTGTPSETTAPQIASATSSPATKTSKPPTAASPEKLTVRVTVTTNCRLGPGVTYPKLTPLQAGKVVPLIGRDKYYSYWIIKDPGGTGQDCWLWGYYAITTGNVSSLPIYDPPADDTATPSPTGPSPTPTDTRTPRPTNTPNLTPATNTNTPLPPTITPTPSKTPTPSNTPTASRTPTATRTPTPSNTPSANQCDSGTYYTISSPYEEQLILNLINQARSANHSDPNTPSSPPLATSQTLVNIARAHGRDMLCNGTSSHTSTDGTRAWERIGLALYGDSNWCYTHCCCGEIYYSGGSYLTPSRAMDWWMTHPEDPPFCPLGNAHKCTILGQWYTKLGVGVTLLVDSNGNTVRKFYTVDFAR